MINQLYNSPAKLQRCLLLIVACEWLVFVFSGVSFSFLYGNSFFSIGVDPVYWIFFTSGIPQAILSQQALAVAMDGIVLLLFALAIYKPLNNKFGIMLAIMLLLFYVTLTGYHTHRNFQAGFVFVMLPFVFKYGKSRMMAYEAARYFLLFFYTSSALLKLFNSGLFDPLHFSNILTHQFAPYFLEGNTGWRTSINLYLVNHSGISHGLFIIAFFVELATAIAFFTKRFDKWLAIFLLLFHFTNWILMDIAPIGQVALICLLFMKNAFKENKG